MKFIIHTQYYEPEIGAPQARLGILARAFVARGHEVTVLTAMPNYPRGVIHPGYGGIYRREERDGVTIHRTFIYPTKSAGMVKRMGNYLSFGASSAALGLRKLPRADFLMTESPPLFLGPSGWTLAAWKRARWIFNVSDLWPESAVRLGVIGPGWKLRQAETLEASCYRRAWLVSGQSPGIVADIERRFPGTRTFLLSNGVDTSVFRPELRNAESRAFLLGDSKADCVAFYGGLHGLAQKLGQVIEAAERLRDLPNLLIVFVGEGPEKDDLIRQAREKGLTNVRFLDPQPREAMPPLLASADIALAPLGMAIPGAVPSKLYEAMGAGLPVVVAAEGEPVEIVERTGTGLTVRPGDAEGLAAALRALATNPERRSEMGRLGRDAAVNLFDRQTIAGRFIDFLEDALSCPSAPSSEPVRTS